MTEAEWQASNHPKAMLDALKAAGRLTERKSRLFAVACCRQVWTLLPDNRCRSALEIAERFADGLATRTEFIDAHFDVSDVVHEMRDDRAAFLCTALTAFHAKPDYAARETVATIGQSKQAKLVRDIFSTLGTINESWLTWNGGAIPDLARRIYEERSLPDGRLNNELLAVLGEYLAEAGCKDAELLKHCRDRDAVHVRGCGALDALLRKE